MMVVMFQMQNSSSAPAPSEDVAELVQQKNTLEGKLQQVSKILNTFLKFNLNL